MAHYIPYTHNNYFESNKFGSNKNIIRIRHANKNNKAVEGFNQAEVVNDLFDSNIAKLDEYEKLSAEMNEKYRQLSSSITAITTHPEYNKKMSIKRAQTLADDMQHDNKLDLVVNRNMMILGSITMATLVVYLAVA
jgi:hypothetical protein